MYIRASGLTILKIETFWHQKHASRTSIVWFFLSGQGEIFVWPGWVFNQYMKPEKLKADSQIMQSCTSILPVLLRPLLIWLITAEGSLGGWNIQGVFLTFKVFKSRPESNFFQKKLKYPDCPPLKSLSVGLPPPPSPKISKCQEFTYRSWYLEILGGGQSGCDYLPADT